MEETRYPDTMLHVRVHHKSTCDCCAFICNICYGIIRKSHISKTKYFQKTIDESLIVFSIFQKVDLSQHQWENLKNIFFGWYIFRVEACVHVLRYQSEWILNGNYTFGCSLIWFLDYVFLFNLFSWITIILK